MNKCTIAGHLDLEVSNALDQAGHSQETAHQDSQKIQIVDGGILIQNLRVSSPEGADLLSKLPMTEWGETVSRSTVFGLECRQRYQATQDVEFVQRQIEITMSLVREECAKLPHQTRDALSKIIGTQRGQVLEDIPGQLDRLKLITHQVEQSLLQRLGTLQTNLDPNNPSSTLGVTMTFLQDMIDPKKKGSIQDVLETTVSQSFGNDSPMASVVKNIVSECTQSRFNTITEELRTLALEVRAQSAVKSALNQTTHKGKVFEEEVFDSLRTEWVGLGARVHRLGLDNKPGDIIIELPKSSITGTCIRLVVECKDDQTGAGVNRITADLETAMAERQANTAIYVTRNAGGLAKTQIGEFDHLETRYGPAIATTFEFLRCAILWVIWRRQQADQTQSKQKVDYSAMNEQLKQLQAAMNQISTAKRDVTKILEVANSLQEKLDENRGKLQDTYLGIKQAISA